MTSTVKILRKGAEQTAYIKMSHEFPTLGLSELIERDLTSSEYFYSLDSDMQAMLMQKDVNTFEEMQSFVRRHKEMRENNKF